MQIFLIGPSTPYYKLTGELKIQVHVGKWSSVLYRLLSIKCLSKRNRKILRVIGLNDNNHVKNSKILAYYIIKTIFKHFIN